MNCIAFILILQHFDLFKNFKNEKYKFVPPKKLILCEKKNYISMDTKMNL